MGVDPVTIGAVLSGIGAATQGVSAVAGVLGGSRDNAATPRPVQQVNTPDTENERQVAEESQRRNAARRSSSGRTVLTSPRGLSAPAQTAGRTILGG